MSSGLELADSRVGRLEIVDGTATVHFSHAYIHKSAGKPGKDAGTGWSQEAVLTMFQATLSGPPPPFPNAISDGFLEVGGIKHALIPLPFKRKVGARLFLQFTDGSQLEVVGEKPVIELLGKPIFLEDFR